MHTDMKLRGIHITITKAKSFKKRERGVFRNRI
jgi:hypothetical protein